MKMCQSHWEEIKAKLTEFGLYHLVPEGGEAAVKKMASMIQEGPNKDNFDPLMMAHNAIVSKCLEVAGPQVLLNDGCPLCHIIDNCGCTLGEDCHFKHWTDGATHAVKRLALELGVIKEQVPS